MIILLLILSLFFAEVAKAATYWVSPTGNDGNPHCFDSAGLPALTNTSRTIKQGTNCLGGGDTLNILAGTYTEDLIAYIDAFQKVPNGSAGAYTTVQAYCPSGICTTPDGLYGPASGAQVVQLNGQIYLYNLNYVQIKNIKVAKAATSSVGNFDGIILGGAAAHHLKVDGVDVTGTCRTGPGCAATSGAVRLTGPDMWVTHTNVHDSAVGESESHTHCWYVEADRALVEWSTCHDWGIGAAIHHYAESPTPILTGGVFRNLLVYNLPNYMPLVMWYGNNVTAYNIVGYNNQEAVRFNNCTNCLVYNSTFVGSTSSSIPVVEITGGSTGAIRNTIVTGNAAVAFGGSDAASLTYSYNLCDSTGASGSVATSCALVEPATTTFANFAARDLHLKTGSATIGAVTTGCPPPANDMTGASRTSPCDAGAYKFGAPVGVASITWSNARGGSGTGTLVGSNWTIGTVDPLIPLGVGVNPITVTYTDANNAQSTATISVTSVPTFPGNALVGAWAFENNGTDSSPSTPSNTATLQPGGSPPTYLAGKFGQALSLDGVNQYALVGDANSIDFTHSFSFSSWVFPTAISNDFTAVIVKNAMLSLHATSVGYCGTGGPLIWFYANGDAGPPHYACYPQPLPINTWTHLAGTYDGSNIRLYVNGNQGVPGGPASPIVSSVSPQAYMEPSNLSLQIGASQYGEYFRGLLDDPRAYNWGIPFSTAVNAAPSGTCTLAMWNDNVNNPSVLGNMNCPIISPAVSPPPVIKFPASATGLKLGAASNAAKFGQVGQ